MEKKRYASFDVLKIVATVCIIFHHYQQYFGMQFSSINFYGGRFYFGLFVELFFMISGFLMFSNIEKIKDGLSFKSFYLRRFFRLFPLQCLTAVVYEALFTLQRWQQFFMNGVDDGFAPRLWYVFTTALGINYGWGIRNVGINNPTWYISVLLFCYILFYVSVFISKKHGFSEYYAFIAIIFIAFYVSTDRVNFLFLNDAIARGCKPFFAGVILAGILKNWHPGRKTYFICASILIAYICTMVFSDGFYVEAKDEMAYILTFMIYPALIILSFSQAVNNIFDRKLINKLAEISFNAYMWHGTALLLLEIIRDQNKAFVNDGILAMFVFLLVIYCLAAASHFFIEKPADKYIKSKIKI